MEREGGAGCVRRTGTNVPVLSNLDTEGGPAQGARHRLFLRPDIVRGAAGHTVERTFGNDPSAWWTVEFLAPDGSWNHAVRGRCRIRNQERVRLRNRARPPSMNLPPSGVTVRQGKLGKSRALPLHPTATTAVQQYLHHADRPAPRHTAALFVSTAGARLLKRNVQHTFLALVRRVGLQPHTTACRPRLHDIRHRSEQGVNGRQSCVSGAHGVRAVMLEVRGRGSLSAPAYQTRRSFPRGRADRSAATPSHSASRRTWPRPRTPALPSAKRPFTPHTLRHTAAMRLLHAGVDTAVIALWLGHEHVDTTNIYIHADLALKERAIDRTTPAHVRAGRYRPPDTLLAFLEGL